jgi:hypothetical protein
MNIELDVFAREEKVQGPIDGKSQFAREPRHLEEVDSAV